MLIIVIIDDINGVKYNIDQDIVMSTPNIRINAYLIIK